MKRPFIVLATLLVLCGTARHNRYCIQRQSLRASSWLRGQ